MVFTPDKTGNTFRTYDKRQKGTIIDDYGRRSIQFVKKYEGFCNVASHVNFQPEIKGFFNKYHPLSHKPSSGKFETITSVLSHVFGDKINFILDYLHLLYMKPTQRLPVLLLESKEKNTGKSTFGTLLKIIFEDNAIKLGNNDFESEFNEIWVSKLCIIVDETSLEKKA
ncbi:DUF5906 domain-containing protein [Dyadobacter sp. NIV53]|uniref:DUF5906 domain-containing protein n=1 Tax=Dyadobacter sp. NIV53 TaxID=2861765 RepID=UPI001C86726D|nr:DUF5906 domain-containing protein [Dyadobacter sp. NIV53]